MPTEAEAPWLPLHVRIALARLPAAGHVVLAFTFVAGVGATIAQVRYADNVQ